MSFLVKKQNLKINIPNGTLSFMKTKFSYSNKLNVGGDKQKISKNKIKMNRKTEI